MAVPAELFSLPAISSSSPTELLFSPGEPLGEVSCPETEESGSKPGGWSDKLADDMSSRDSKSGTAQFFRELLLERLNFETDLLIFPVG